MLTIETWMVTRSAVGGWERLELLRSMQVATIDDELECHLSSDQEWDYEAYGPTQSYIRFPAGLLPLSGLQVPDENETREAFEDQPEMGSIDVEPDERVVV